MKRLLQLLLILAFVGIGLFFGALNESKVTVDYFLFRLEWPLALSLAAFFFAGALIGGLVTYLGSWLALHRRIRRARDQSRTPPADPPALPKSSSPND